MGSGSRFRLPSALKRTKSSAQQQDWQPEGKEHKVHHILGISETDLNTARNQSISSSVTARLPTLSFSDATTELGSSNPPTEQSDTSRDLNGKASSVLLHEEYLLKADVPGSTHPKRLKAQGSSSTLHSFYDAQKTPLAISQQTSDSSRRDFALRKGAPVVVKPTTTDADPIRRLKFFRLSRHGSKAGEKAPTQAVPESPESAGKMRLSNQRSLRSSDRGADSGSVHSNPPSKLKKGVRFNSDRPTTLISPEKPKSSVRLASQQEAHQYKINIRRPKAGAKHWFDGLEGDSSDDESVDEPALQPSFVAGFEMAFEGGRIGMVAVDEPCTTPRALDHPARSTSSRTESSHILPVSVIPPRVSTLNAKSSRSTLSPNESHLTSPKGKAGSLGSTDLHQTSVLDLSSSDEDEPLAPTIKSPSMPLPEIRDSIAVESLGESDIEVGTAKTISTKQNTSVKATPSLKRVRAPQHGRDVGESMKPPNRRRDPRSTYYSCLDLSSNPMPEEDDLLTSFPPTPTTDQSSFRRASFPDIPLSDTASIESRRLMSVTKQEESLLAAIRSKKAVQGKSYSASTESRIQALMNTDRKPLKRKQQGPRSSPALDIQFTTQGRMLERVQSPSSDTNFDQASCTTFQTGLSNDPSVRYSITSFHTGTPVAPDTEIASSFAPSPSGFLQPRTDGPNRMSRSTFFSTSTTSSRDDSRSRKERQYLATLERLQAPPRREEVSSQDFIDWPYNGWMKVATAH
ncbi:hypothetical protein A1O7_09927 [Cladophialophora yegresii CBS 114405]|uniref:Uncharacterized protein n=1 Tax=Cladophialophora yegresii CBS 114405 TaxID=1182544 RepID=W9VQZ5_9EURO|nr:uncharacterized protein A1O7_09927 [Cladophialophora yegresii CBS 114405]EXJ54586.1 hypothetical protein A1O7_09927 [Cladophialophora yegresii CBS 114405]